MNIKNRVKELRNVRAGDLIPNPKNWRLHPDAQRKAVEGVLKEVGYTDALIARETPEGLMLIDGHLRSEITPDTDVPVLIVDLSEDEADLVLTTLDPLAGMALTDNKQLAELIASINAGDNTKELLDAIAEDYGITHPDIDFPEYDESIKDTVKKHVCPECGFEFV